MRRIVLISGLVLTGAGFSWGVEPARAPVPRAPAVMDQRADPVQLRGLRAVQDLRERPTKWQQAADEAVSKVRDPEVQKEVRQRLDEIGPQVAKDLMATPGESAVVTVATYKDADEGEQTVAAVAYEGLGDSLSRSFFPRVLADMPQARRALQEEQQKEGGNPKTQPATRPAADQHLVLDAPASGYLVFFLDKGDLKAGYIPQAMMKQSLGLAIQQARRPNPVAPSPADAAADAAARREQLAAQRRADAAARQEDLDRQRQAAADNAQQAAGRYGADNTVYTNPNPNNGAYYGPYGYVGPQGVYSNAYGWQPYLIVPGGNRRDHDRHDPHDAAEVLRRAQEAGQAPNKIAAEAGEVTKPPGQQPPLPGKTDSPSNSANPSPSAPNTVKPNTGSGAPSTPAPAQARPAPSAPPAAKPAPSAPAPAKPAPAPAPAKK